MQLEHTLLRPEQTEADVLAGCALAARHHLAAVCVKPCHVKLAADALRGTGVRVCSVVGFPHGANATSVKVAEAYQVISDGAVELDVVLNIGAVRGGQMQLAQDDLRAVCEVARALGVSAKVIFETAYLTDEQKIAVCGMCNMAGADWAVTSTGYAPAGATIDDIKLMRANLDPRVQIKATQSFLRIYAEQALCDAGASRVSVNYELMVPNL
jgi:deoxyribose-phosphate aldolase